MTWVRTEDGTPSHPKHIRAGAEACWLWQCGLCYSNAHRLDGRLAKDVLPALYAPLAAKAKRLASVLCRVGLWHDRGDHYEIHDYADYQEQALKEAVEARREYERDRKREQRSGTKTPKSPGPVPDNVPQPAGAVPSVTRASPVPSRPVPSEITETRACLPDSEMPLVAVAADLVPDNEADRRSPDRQELTPDHPLADPVVQRVRRNYKILLETLATFPSQTAGNARHELAIAAWARTNFSEPETGLRAAFIGFESDEWSKKATYPLGNLANNAGKFYRIGLEILAAEQGEAS